MKMIGRLIILLGRARDVFKEEGLIVVLRRGLALGCSIFFECGNYYLHEHMLEEKNEADFMPGIHNFNFKIVHNNEEADELVSNIGIDFRKRFVDSRRRLDKGAIAFGIFVNGEIAHIGWVALSEEAKKAVDSLPFKVDFSNKEACTGGTETVPEYRGKGLMVYGYFKRLEFLRERGVILSRSSVAVDNIASQKAHARFSYKIYAEARYLRLLWWKLLRIKAR